MGIASCQKCYKGIEFELEVDRTNPSQVPNQDKDIYKPKESSHSKPKNKDRATYQHSHLT